MLPIQRLLPRWNIIPALTAKDPENENISLVSFFVAFSRDVLIVEKGKSILAAIVRQGAKYSQGLCLSIAWERELIKSIEDRIERVEMPFARLLLLLTHHPDLQWDETGLKDIAR